MVQQRGGRRWVWRIGLCAALGVACGLGLWMSAGLAANEAGSKSAARSSRPPTDEGERWKALEEKLHRVLEGQDKILKRFDDVMAELQIVKTRASNR